MRGGGRGAPRPLTTARARRRPPRLTRRRPSAPPGPPPRNEDPLRRGTSNLPWVDTCPWTCLNVYSILQRDYLVLSRRALDRTVQRMRRPIKPSSKTP